ncbi:MAG: hypothetical protein R3350_10710, partial [Saprospiraceae bacterium]|nr:hypothetical protein [Saprospiraceae bacterium]
VSPPSPRLWRLYITLLTSHGIDLSLHCSFRQSQAGKLTQTLRASGLILYENENGQPISGTDIMMK